MYLHLFETENDFNTAYNGTAYTEPWVSYTKQGESVNYNKGASPYLGVPFTMEILETGRLVWHYPNNFDVQYKKNNGEWTNLPNNTQDDYADGMDLVSGDTVSFRGNNTGSTDFYSNGISFRDSEWNEKKFNVYGNIMSLISRTDFENLTTIPTNFKFAGLLKYTYVVNAENLVLPATTLSESCYNTLFASCAELLTAPELPATILPTGCYTAMFEECVKLTVAPTIPATAVSFISCNQMFIGCIGLTNVQSVLPAMTMANGCYASMFEGCTSLTTAPELPATVMDNQCYDSMFKGCTGLTTGPAVLPALTLAQNSYTSMFSGCTSLTTAPVISATTLWANCCDYMFCNCASLTTAPPILPAMTMEQECYMSMFEGCTSLTTAPELPAASLLDGCYSYMFYGCTNLSYVKCLATSNPGDEDEGYSTNGWLDGVAASGTFVKASSMMDWTRDENGIPAGWSIQNT